MTKNTNELTDGKYYDCWSCRDDVGKDYKEIYEIPEEDIIYAGYTYEYYSGNAIVVFKRDGKIFENHDSHCSCNGLDLWQPEEGIKEAIAKYDWPGLAKALERV